jgi:DNA-binding Xre family transcriptional regulator
MKPGPQLPQSGDRVVITKLMLKLQTAKQPNYVVGAACGIHPTTLSFYSRGLKPISAKHLIALCKLFECEPEELVGNITVEIE